MKPYAPKYIQFKFSLGWVSWVLGCLPVLLEGTEIYICSGYQRFSEMEKPPRVLTRPKSRWKLEWLVADIRETSRKYMYGQLNYLAQTIRFVLCWPKDTNYFVGCGCLFSRVITGLKYDSLYLWILKPKKIFDEHLLYARPLWWFWEKNNQYGVFFVSMKLLF